MLRTFRQEGLQWTVISYEGSSVTCDCWEHTHDIYTVGRHNWAMLRSAAVAVDSLTEPTESLAPSSGSHTPESRCN